MQKEKFNKYQALFKLEKTVMEGYEIPRKGNIE